MAKKYKSGLCAHCLCDSPVRTADHVFPKAWYPESTPANLEKWQMPSCERCNADYGRLEEDLLLRLGLCISDSARESLGIGTKVVNALDPSRAKSPRDARIRLAKAKKILQDSKRATPGMNIRSFTDDPGGVAIGIRIPDLVSLATRACPEHFLLI